ncbi:hypothetical protein M5X17_27790 [Paenibacillus alvei]|uniref:hypothetical protein n=1 Tax=Paenibacillus alvei TaxID=44250 RepID=UPI0022816DE5|nr:hypothetical protein [Paenibacillus alvei]MCY9737509.1 hypothetical protein [Paenibacillus alvei]
MNTNQFIEKMKSNLEAVELMIAQQKEELEEFAKQWETAATTEYPLTREQVIKNSKEFIKGLSKPHHTYLEDTVFSDGEYLHQASFVINRRNRAVVCFLQRYGRKQVSYTGIAKCMKDDVFNVHIGMAIALAKALNKEIPAEFVNASQPNVSQVGDYIEYKGFVVKVEPPNDVTGRTYNYEKGDCAVGSIAATNGRIIDDSRDAHTYDEVYTISV